MRGRILLSIAAVALLTAATLLLYADGVRGNIRVKTLETLSETATRYADDVREKLEARFCALEGRREGFSRVFAVESANARRAVRKTADGFLLSVPSPDGRRAICGVLPESALMERRGEAEYEGMLYAFLCDRNGRLITRGEGDYFLHVSDDLFDLYAEGTIEGDTERGIRMGMAQGASGAYCVRLGSLSLCAAYAPLDRNGWLVVCGVPEHIAVRSETRLLRNGALLAARMVLLTLAAMGAVLIAQRRRLRAAQADGERYRVVGEFSDTVLFEADVRRDTISFGGRYAEVFGDAPLPARLSDFLLQNPCAAPEDLDTLRLLHREMTRGESSAREFRLCTACGCYQWMRMEYRALAGDGARMVGRLLNIDGQRREIEALREKAASDSLTSLRNRVAFRESASSRIARGGMHALLLIDIDDFKRVNDILGHMVGDDALTGVAEAMQATFRASDLVGRLGGDEFCVLMTELRDRETACARARALMEAVSRVPLGACAAALSCSVGIAFAPLDGDTFEALYAYADQALYRAKALGKGRFWVYNNICGI